MLLTIRHSSLMAYQTTLFFSTVPALQRVTKEMINR